MKSGIIHKSFWFLLLLLGYASVLAQGLLDVTYTAVNPTDDNQFGGQINLEISGGTTPYRIEWCDRTRKDSSVNTGLKAGLHKCLITDANGDIVQLSIPLYFGPVWDSVFNGFTQNRLSDGEDGWAQFTVLDSTLDAKVGFIYNNTVSDDTIDVGFDFSNALLKIFVGEEEYTFASPVNNLTTGDIFKIERVGHLFRFYKNGEKLIEVSSAIDLALESQGMKFGYQRFGMDFPTEFPLEKFEEIRLTFGVGYSGFYYGYKECDDDYNWVYNEIYNGANVPLAATKQFLDHLGRPVQSQAMNVSVNKILASETRYDELGRPVLSSLPAPINNTTFCFKQNFIVTTKNNQIVDYTWEEFDNSSFINQPYEVHTTGYGDLGWYYSNHNTLEPYVPASSFPYSRVEYQPYPGGSVRRTASAGEELKFGSGHEKEVYSMPESGELKYVFGSVADYQTLRNPDDNLNPKNVKTYQSKGIAAYKTITVDENGTEQITYTNSQGQVIATCLSNSGACPSGGQTGKLRIKGEHNATMHVPSEFMNAQTQFNVTMKPFYGKLIQANELDLKIVDMKTNQLLVAGTDYTLNIATPCSTTYYIQDDQPLTAAQCTTCLWQPSYAFVECISFSLSSTYCNSHPGAGYFRVYNNTDHLQEVKKTDYIEIEHPLNYGNWTINYYDGVTGLLTKVIPLSGIDCGFEPYNAPIIDNENHKLEVYDRSGAEYLIPEVDYFDHTVTTAAQGYTKRKIFNLSLSPDYYDDNTQSGYNFAPWELISNPPAEWGLTSYTSYGGDAAQTTEPTWCELLEDIEKPKPVLNEWTVFNPPGGLVPESVDLTAFAGFDHFKYDPEKVTYHPVVQLHSADGPLLKRASLGTGSGLVDLISRTIVSTDEYTLKELGEIYTNQLNGFSSATQKMAMFKHTGKDFATFPGTNNIASIFPFGGSVPGFCNGSAYDCYIDHNIDNTANIDYTRLYYNTTDWAHLYYYLHCCPLLRTVPNFFNDCFTYYDPEDPDINDIQNPYEQVEHLATFYIDATLIAENTTNSNIAAVSKPVKLRLSVADVCCKLYWYGGRISGDVFSHEELEGRDNVRIRINGVKVGTGGDPDEYVNPSTWMTNNAPTAFVPPHVIQPFNPSLRYHDLLRFCIINLGITTIQTPDLLPDHTMPTTYCYDGYGQMLATQSPDEGRVEAKYDSEGKIRFTQDAEQRAQSKFSFVNYDAEDRVVNTGEYDYDASGYTPAASYFFEQDIVLATGGTTPPADYLSLNDVIDDVFTTGSNSHFNDVTNLYYDVPLTLPSGSGLSEPHYTTGRLVKSETGAYETYYSYNYLGLPEWNLKDIPVGLKTVEYEYDILGNLTKTAYQRNTDYESFYHYYKYDKALRLSEVRTGFDGILANADLQAKYQYYLHGPLKRKELGDKIQGIDYVYTINGWLKSINQPDMAHYWQDPGGDGTWYGDPGNTPVADPNGFAFDVFSETLDYFPGDYTRAGTGIQTYNNYLHNDFTTDPYSNGNWSGTTWSSDKPQVSVVPRHYNGLIQSATWRTLTDNDEINPVLHDPNSTVSDAGARMQLFEYDHKYQLKAAVFGTVAERGTLNCSSCTPVPPAFTPANDYLTYNLTYDKNGNIQSLIRKGSSASGGWLDRDNLDYQYIAGTNRLDFVDDNATTPTPADPTLSGFAAQATGNYGYDASGRIIADAGANVTMAYHHNSKLEEVYDNSNLKTKLYYDEAGNRIMKIKYDATGTTAEKITYYVYDGSGNLMALYDENDPGGSADLDVEYPVYGNSRIGAWHTTLQWQSGTSTFTRTVHNNVFELTDHLGTVRAVVEGEKDSKGHPEIVSTNDFYPHGGTMPGRSYNPPGAGLNRLGYQGKEFLAENGLYDFGLRMYNADLGRWLSPDPMKQHFSPYLAMSNNPISFIDPTGGEDGDANGIDDAIDDFQRRVRVYTESVANDIFNLNSDMQDPAFRDSYRGQHSSIENVYIRNFFNAFSEKIFINAFNQKTQIEVPYEKRTTVNTYEQWKEIQPRIEGGSTGLTGGGIYYTIEKELVGVDDFINAAAGRKVNLGFDNSGTSSFNSSKEQSDYYKAYGMGIQGFATFLEKGYAIALGTLFGGMIEAGVAAGAARTSALIAEQKMVSAVTKATTATELVALGLGSTGRTTAINLVEQMAMENILSNPNLGTVVQEGMKDSRWFGWSKLQYVVETQNGVKAVIHYVGKFKNGVLKAVDDFKFKP